MSKYLLVFLCLLVAVLACNPGVSCLHGECFENGCLCASGWQGSDCSVKVSQCDDSFLKLGSMVSSPTPLLDKSASSLTSGGLKLSISLPLIEDRLSSKVSLGTSGLPACQVSWKKSFQDCREIFSLSLDWEDAMKCGFKEETHDGVTTFSSWVNFAGNDMVANFRGRPITRLTESRIPVSLRLAGSVKVGEVIPVE